MSEKPQDNPAESPETDAKPPLYLRMPVLISGVMIAEALVLIGAFKLLGGGPSAAVGQELAIVETVASDTELVEVPVDAFRAPNRLDGRTYLYDVEISVRVRADRRDEVEQRLRNSTALVRDRLNRIIAQIDPQKLNGAMEPGLETLRRQVKFQLDLIVGEGLIEEVLVPRCIPYRTDY